MTEENKQPISEEELLQLAKQQQQQEKNNTLQEETIEVDAPEEDTSEVPESTRRLLEAEKKASEEGEINFTFLDPEKESPEFNPSISETNHQKMLELSGVTELREEALEKARVKDTEVKPEENREVEGPSLSEEYTGPGLVIDNDDLKSEDEEVGDLSKHTEDSIAEYLKNMEQDFEDSKEIRMKLGAVVDPTTLSKEELEEINHPAREEIIRRETGIEIDEEEEVVAPDIDVEEDNSKKVSEGVIIIDKLNSDSLQLSDDERDKLEKVRKIRIDEIESIPMSVTRRHKPKNQLQALKQLRARHGTTIRSFIVALPVSGYTATVTGASPFEIMTLRGDQDDPINDAMTKWSLVHSKIKDTSLGKLSFDEFMNQTAVSELDTLIYGVMCSTFPEKDSIELECEVENCGGEYKVDYDVRQLINFETLAPVSFNMINDLANHAITKEASEEIHAKSPLRMNKEFTLPDSGYIVTAAPTSAQRFVDDVLGFTSKEDSSQDKAQAVFMSMYIDSISIPEDPLDIQGEYYKFTDFETLVEIVFGLTADDIQILAKMFDEYYDNNSFNFGLRDVTCPKCKNHTEFVSIPVEQMLFYRNDQAMNRG